MNIKNYIEEIRNRISILDLESQEKELNEIEKKINEELAIGLTEEQILKNYPVDNQVLTILKKHGINTDFIGQNKTKTKDKFNQLFNMFYKLLDIMAKNDFKANIKIIGDLLILVVLICLLDIPFILIRNLGDSLIQYINVPYMYNIWGIIINILYIIVAILIFLNIFPKWFKNLKPTPKKAKKVNVAKLGEDLTSISLNDISQDKEVKKE